MPLNVACCHTGVQGEKFWLHDIAFVYTRLGLFMPYLVESLSEDDPVLMTRLYCCWLWQVDNHCYCDIQFVFDWFAFCSYSTRPVV